MKYFIDTEFIEDFTNPLFGRPRHYIDLISIGIVAEDGREYYAVSNEFDIDHVWDKFQIKEDFGKPQGPGDKKEYWLRDNVLLPLVLELVERDYNDNGWYFADFESPKNWLDFIKQSPSWERTWKRRAKELIKKYGKRNRRIAEEIAYFAGKGLGKPEFYGYYADYDWVLFCSLYGRMLDLPDEFPMYCRDLKQMLDEKQESTPNVQRAAWNKGFPSIEDHFSIKNDPNYPKQTNEHNALADARWNRDLYNFLQTV